MPVSRHRWIVERNVQRFRELLRTETDSALRETLERLIVEEQAKLNQPSKNC